MSDKEIISRLLTIIKLYDCKEYEDFKYTYIDIQALKRCFKINNQFKKENEELKKFKETEEIDIIELFKRVKEGKAPKKIEIENEIFIFYNTISFENLYITNSGRNWVLCKNINLTIKIKILDE